jgi:accessory colonization factor AcfC
MLIVSKETMNSALSLREKMANREKRAECIADLENMINIKESHLARAEWASCCGNICNLASQIDSELRILRNSLEVLKKKDSSKASALFEDYIALLQENYTPEPEHW